MKVIGVAGQMQNGKDTVANYLASKLVYQKHEVDPIQDQSYPMNFSWKRSAFALEVKKIYCDTFDVDMDFIEEWKVKDEVPPLFDMPCRQGLQFIGDGFRKIQGNVWINKAFRNLKEPTIFSDARYINELAAIKTNGGVTILVWRPGRENDDPNGSEAQIRKLVDWFSQTGMEGNVVGDLIRSKALYDKPIPEIPEDCKKIDLFLINNGNMEELYRKVDRIVVPYVNRKYGVK